MKTLDYAKYASAPIGDTDMAQELGRDLRELLEPLRARCLITAALAAALGDEIARVARNEQSMYRGVQIHSALIEAAACCSFAERAQEAADAGSKDGSPTDRGFKAVH